MRNSLVIMKFALRVIFTRPPFSKWLPTKSSNCQWSPISMNIDIKEYFEVRNWLVMMNFASSVFASIYNQTSLLFLIGRVVNIIL